MLNQSCELTAANWLKTALLNCF